MNIVPSSKAKKAMLITTLRRLRLWWPLIFPITAFVVITTLMIGLFLQHVTFVELGFEHGVEIALILMAGYFLFESIYRMLERTELIDKTHATLESLIESNGVTRVLRAPGEYYRYLISSVANAQTSIQMTYLEDHEPARIGRESLNYWEWFIRFAQKNRHDVTIRRIARLNNPAKIKFLLDSTVALREAPLYALRCFPVDDNAPCLGLDVIDGREVFFYSPYAVNRPIVHSISDTVGDAISSHFEAMWDYLGSEAEVKGLNEKPAEDLICKRIQKLATPAQSSGTSF